MATATQWAHTKELDTKKRSSTSCHFEDALRQKIVGQDEAVQALVDLYQTFCVGLNSPTRPVGNLLFLGPTGSGKTRIVEAAAEILSGDTGHRASVRVMCFLSIGIPATKGWPSEGYETALIRYTDGLRRRIRVTLQPWKFEEYRYGNAFT